MNTITTTQQFNFNTLAIRIVLIAAAPWFVASDVCQALGLTNSRMALSKLDEDEKGVSSIDTLGGVQQAAVVSESGLYSLVLGSRKPEARCFKKWVTSEVLPAIHRTGCYQLDVEPLEFDETAGGLKRARSAYNQWAYEARTLLKQAGVKPPDWPFDPDDNTALATAVVSNLLSNRRWLLSFDGEMRPQMTAMPANSYAVTADQLPDLIREAGQVPLMVLPRIIEAAAQRLGDSIRSKAVRA